MVTDLQCANCNQRLDPTDKFCRECGLPTVHRSETQRQAAATPPNAEEMKRAMDVAADPRPFERPVEQTEAMPPMRPELTTGSVVKVTSPTFAAQMAGSTLLMVGLIVVLVVIGIGMIVLALRF
jgi:hypothetical protein